MKNTQSHKTIIISAYRNVSIRYLLYGEILDQLIESGLRVVVLVNEENLDYYINKFKDKKIIIEPIFYFKNLRTLRSRLGSVLNTYRLCTSPQGKKINKNTTVDIFKKIYKKEWSENIKGYGVFLLILLVSNVASKSLLIRNLMIKLESLIFKGKQYDNLFKKYDPELLIVSSVGHMLDLYIMNSSKRNNTKIMTIFHNWDGPTTKGYRANEIDYAVVWNQTMKKEVEIYQDISRDRIFVGGCSNYDIFFNQNTYFNTKKTFFDYFQLDSNKKTILYAPGGHNYFPNSLDTLEVILESITNNYYSSEVQVLLRGHPNSIGKEDVKKKIDLLLEKYGEHLKVSMPISKKLNFDVDLSMEDIKILSDILSYSDLIVTQYSTLLIESSIFDLPAINSGIGYFRDFDDSAIMLDTLTHIKSINKYNAFDNVHSIDELNKCIEKYLVNPKVNSEERKNFSENLVGVNKGFSGKSIGKFIAEVA